MVFIFDKIFNYNEFIHNKFIYTNIQINHVNNKCFTHSTPITSAYASLPARA